MNAKRTLFLVHRWLGVGLCLLMAMWFVSGVVMMYVGYPKLTPAERLAALPELAPTDCCIALRRALADNDIVAPRDVRLSTVMGRPAYLVTDASGRPHAIDARDATRLGAADARAALAAAAQFAPGVAARYVDQVQEDWWTHSRALDAHRALHRVRIDDGASRLLYVSSRTGEVVRDATATERAWNWLGAWLHWLYMFRGNAFDPWWTDIVVWTSTAGTALVLSGAIVGVLRMRLRLRYRSGARSPYREPFMRWHHWTGIAFALVCFTWILSGLLSMSPPWKPFESDGPRPDPRALAGGAFAATQFNRAPDEVLRAFGESIRPRELRLIRFDGASWWLAVDGIGRTRLLADVDGETRASHSRETLLAAAPKLMAHARVVEAVWLERHDAYYYARAAHTMLGHVERPLPVLRVKFDDARASWAHIDPASGTLIGVSDRLQRVRRWLFAFLHSFDWLPLLERRPLWDVLLIVLSAGGLAVSTTGVVIGWRRLREKGRTLAQPARYFR